MNFIDFARLHGVEIDKLDASGRIRRCGTTLHPRSDNGAYLYDGRRGWVMAWDGDGEVHWIDDGSTPWTDADKRAWAAQREAQRASKERGYRQAATRAAEMLRTCLKGPSKYLQYKGFGDMPSLVLRDGALFVPMYSLVGDLQGAQVIRWNPEARSHEKKMLPGMKAKGAVHRIGPRNAVTTILCEGYATALSIKAACDQMRLSASVLVCFSDSNLVYVASKLAGSRYVFADNDASGAGERAAQATGLPYCMAPEVGMDANDMHNRDGLFAVAGLIQRTRSTDSTR